MRFKDLEVGDTFEFTHYTLSGERITWTGAVGPWKKRTARTYVYADNRSTQHFRVGTVLVDVKKVTR